MGYQLVDSKNHISKKTLPLTIVPSLNNTSVISEEVIALGDTVNVEASATDGIGSYEYAVFMKKTGDAEFSVVSDYCENATTQIRPAADGEYTILTRIRDSRGHIAEKTLSLKVNPALENTTVLSETEIALGDTVRVMYSAQGGMGGYQYAVYTMAPGETSWTLVSGYSSEAYFSFTPDAVGNYGFLVRVRDAKNHIVKKTLSLKVNPALENISALSEELIALGDTVTVNTAAQGGVPGYQFAVYTMAPGETSWRTVTGYTDSDSTALIPEAAGDHKILVKAIDSRNHLSKKTYSNSKCRSCLWYSRI